MTIEERKLVALLAALQFIDALEYQLVDPLSPDMSRAVGFSLADVSVLAGAYSLSAVLSSLWGVLFLDRLDRRVALCTVMFGLLLSTAATALAPNFTVLIGARLLAGLFGGLGGTLISVILLDHVATERRARALGWVYTSAIASSMAGVPAGLQLALMSSWRVTFLLVAVTGGVLTFLSLRVMQAMPVCNYTVHASTERPWRSVFTASGLLCCLLMFNAACTAYLITLNLSAYLQYSLSFPRQQLGGLYMLGSVGMLAALQIAGRFSDKSAVPVVVVASHLLLTAILCVAFVFPGSAVSIWAWFVLLNAAIAACMVSAFTFIMLTPEPWERGAFVSVMSCLRHGAIAVSTLVSTRVLDVAPDGALLNFQTLGTISAALAIVSPVIAVTLHRRRVRSRSAAESYEL